jgi:hypothetical protein
MKARLITVGTAALLLTMLVVVGGCGDDDVDASKAEQGIESSSLSTSTTQVTSASCPDNVKKEKADTFTCDVELSGGGSAKVTVTQTSDHNTFSYAYKAGSVELPGSTLDKEIEQDLDKAGVSGATVNCPTTVKVVSGETVTCPVTTAKGIEGTVSFTFTDSSGSIDESSVKESD